MSGEHGPSSDIGNDDDMCDYGRVSHHVVAVVGHYRIKIITQIIIKKYPSLR